MHDRFNRWSDTVGHDVEIRPNNRKDQHVVFSVHALHHKVIQESEDKIRTRMHPRLRHEMTMNPDLVVLAGKFSHDKLERDIMTTQEG